MSFCEACFGKQQEIDRLRTENEYLRGKLLSQVRNAKEKPFGANTPSAKKNFKPNSDAKKAKRKGGAKPGHTGRGRCCTGTPDEIIDIQAPEHCPDCGQPAINYGTRERTVKDMPKLEVKIVRYVQQRNYCPHCQKIVTDKNVPVLPHSMLGNELLTHIAVQHYLHGVPLGRLAAQLGINIGTLVGSLHRLRELFKPALPKLIQDYRRAPVKHADETSWRNNGSNGYAWFFAAKDTALFCLRQTRSGKVAQEVLGNEPLPGVLVVDRYNGYNKAPCEIQYCGSASSPY